MRGFRRISLEQATKDGLTFEQWEKIQLPTRATVCSAGYDIRAAATVDIYPNRAVRIPTGIKVCMEDNEVFYVHIRSSLGVKKGLRLANATGIIDSDYIYADNEGHIWVFVHNDGVTKYRIMEGDRFAQGIFHKYLVIDGDSASDERVGGMGSTGEQ